MGVAYALNTPPPLPRCHPPQEEQIPPVKNTKTRAQEWPSDTIMSCICDTHSPVCLTSQPLLIFPFCSHANNFQPTFSKPTFIIWRFLLHYVNYQFQSDLQFHFHVYKYVAYIIHISCTKNKGWFIVFSSLNIHVSCSYVYELNNCYTTV